MRNELPTWWKWVDPGAPDESDDPGVRIALCVVHPDHGEGVACVCEREGAIGAWFEIDDGELRVECGGFANAADAQHACERVYVTITSTLQLIAAKRQALGAVFSNEAPSAELLRFNQGYYCGDIRKEVGDE